jgi:hypothetical protein
MASSAQTNGLTCPFSCAYRSDSPFSSRWMSSGSWIPAPMQQPGHSSSHRGQGSGHRRPSERHAACGRRPGLLPADMSPGAVSGGEPAPPPSAAWVGSDARGLQVVSPCVRYHGLTHPPSWLTQKGAGGCARAGPRVGRSPGYRNGVARPLIRTVADGEAHQWRRLASRHRGAGNTGDVAEHSRHHVGLRATRPNGPLMPEMHQSAPLPCWHRHVPTQ